MALNIVRHDITRIKADAIVNSTNEDFIVGGLGVDASIHYAAGPKLQEALSEIGHCPVGSAVITSSMPSRRCLSTGGMVKNNCWKAATGRSSASP